MVSFFGRFNYNLLNRYLITFTLRDDGSSRFVKDQRWGLFPAAAFAWKLKEEKFLKNMAKIVIIGLGHVGLSYLEKLVFDKSISGEVVLIDKDVEKLKGEILL